MRLVIVTEKGETLHVADDIEEFDPESPRERADLARMIKAAIAKVTVRAPASV